MLIHLQLGIVQKNNMFTNNLNVAEAHSEVLIIVYVCGVLDKECTVVKSLVLN